MLKYITFTKVFIGYGLKRAWVSTLAHFYLVDACLAKGVIS